ncbi:MAG: hypothetical protein H7282_09590 [Cytophagaceae bacterium]|nr:hypothetical protein [Cytophagaceae bacterium]
MFNEIESDYAFTYDLLRNYVLELIHQGQKLLQASAMHSTHNASASSAAIKSLSVLKIQSVADLRNFLLLSFEM